MNEMLLWLVACILGLIAVLHFFWGFGMSWGIEASIPWTRNGDTFSKPNSAASLAVAFSMMIAAAGVLMPYDPWLKAQSLRFMALILGLRALGDFRYSGFSKRIVGSRFAYWDTYAYSPACVVVAGLALLATIA